MPLLSLADVQALFTKRDIGLTEATVTWSCNGNGEWQVNEEHKDKFTVFYEQSMAPELHISARALSTKTAVRVIASVGPSFWSAVCPALATVLLKNFHTVHTDFNAHSCMQLSELKERCLKIIEQSLDEAAKLVFEGAYKPQGGPPRQYQLHTMTSEAIPTVDSGTVTSVSLMLTQDHTWPTEDPEDAP